MNSLLSVIALLELLTLHSLNLKDFGKLTIHRFQVEQWRSASNISIGCSDYSIDVSLGVYQAGQNC